MHDKAGPVTMVMPFVPPVQAIEELGTWDGQSPPTPKHQKGKIISPKIKDVVGKVWEEGRRWSVEGRVRKEVECGGKSREGDGVWREE